MGTNNQDLEDSFGCEYCNKTVAIDSRFCSACGNPIEGKRISSKATAKHHFKESSADRWTQKAATHSKSQWLIFAILFGLIGAATIYVLSIKSQSEYSFAVTPNELCERFNIHSRKTKLSMTQPDLDDLRGFTAHIKLGEQQQSDLRLTGKLNSRGEIESVELTQHTIAEDDASNNNESMRFMVSEIELASALDSSLYGESMENLIKQLDPKVDESTCTLHGAKYTLQSGGTPWEHFRWKLSVVKIEEAMHASPKVRTNAASPLPSSELMAPTKSISHSETSPNNGSSKLSRLSTTMDCNSFIQSKPLRGILRKILGNRFSAFSGYVQQIDDWQKQDSKRFLSGGAAHARTTNEFFLLADLETDRCIAGELTGDDLNIFGAQSRSDLPPRVKKWLVDLESRRNEYGSSSTIRLHFKHSVAGSKFIESNMRPWIDCESDEQPPTPSPTPLSR